MAAAEARAAWQRTVNRCFVQEDAKRAPKLACCQSSSSSSKQADAGSTNASDGPDLPTLGFMPFNQNPSYSKLPLDAKWWLHMQPNYGQQRGLTHEQVNTMDSDAEKPGIDASDANSITGEVSSVDYKDLDSYLDVKKHTEAKHKDFDVRNGKVDPDFLEVNDMTDYYEFLEMELVGGSVSRRTSVYSSNPNSPWAASEKVPWWHVADKDDLASLVAQKSLRRVENCDLPPPQKLHVRKESGKVGKHMDHDDICVSPDWEALSETISDSPSGSSSFSGGSQRSQWASSNEGEGQNVNIVSQPLSTNYADENPRISDFDPSKAKLLEALCHSQTRAREAEKAAQLAYAEKEHIVKLFFKQASHLFAYRQWFNLLQLESLCLQMKNKDSSTSMLLPVLLPWGSHKPRKPRKNKAKRRKRGPWRLNIGKYAVAFAVGFSLVGAGLLLGWTVAWLLPAF